MKIPTFFLASLSRSRSPPTTRGGISDRHPFYDRLGNVANREERKYCNVGILVDGGGFVADRATIHIETLDLQCAIIGSFSAYDKEGRKATGDVRFQIVEYYDTVRGESIRVDR